MRAHGKKKLAYLCALCGRRSRVRLTQLTCERAVGPTGYSPFKKCCPFGCLSARVISKTARQISLNFYSLWERHVKAISVQPWTGFEGYKRLRLPHFKTIRT